jgi:acyl-coenzyme A thioesterase PaaI-like protein
LTSEVLERQRVGRFEFAPHNCFACGRLNRDGLQLDLHAKAGRCWTDLAIPERFEGWAGIVHGGVVTAILDEVMAWSLIDEDSLGFTARLNVEFKRPMAVGTAIHAEGWITDRRKRRFETAASVTDAVSGAVLAEATAVYLAAPPDQQAELRARYDIRRAPAGEPG